MIVYVNILASVLMLVSWSSGASTRNDISSLCPLTDSEASPQFYQVFGGVCFHFVMDRGLPWRLARDDCISRNGSLAVILSEEVNDFIAQELKNTYKEATYEVWIGLDDLREERNFTWANGSALEYMNFARDNGPENRGVFGGPLGSMEDCVAINKYNGKWYDVQCDNTFIAIFTANVNKNYICQYIPSFEPQDDESLCPKTVKCLLDCQMDGYKTDENGCLLCECDV